MKSIVERLRGLDTFGYQSQLACEAATLIEQQAERIKELERATITHDEWYAKCNELAALRQRIADAPVVAWMGEYNINDIRDHYTVVMRHKTDFDGVPDRVRPLYTHPQPAIPDGWQLVPVEPTEEEIDAPRYLFQAIELGIKNIEDIRKHMERCGVDISCTPEWFRKDSGHLTKAGKAIVVRSLMLAAAPKEMK